MEMGFFRHRVHRGFEIPGEFRAHVLLEQLDHDLLF
jgi:hypothetical protein